MVRGLQIYVLGQDVVMANHEMQQILQKNSYFGDHLKSAFYHYQFKIVARRHTNQFHNKILN